MMLLDVMNGGRTRLYRYSLSQPSVAWLDKLFINRIPKRLILVEVAFFGKSESAKFKNLYNYKDILNILRHLKLEIVPLQFVTVGNP